MRKGGSDNAIRAVQKWFKESVIYENEPYIIDYEQAAAVADDSLNTIVVARAGSGKTRTLVAKLVYLVARCGIKPDEIMAFVFNANAAKEINERLAKMRVDGMAVIEEGANIASTFHAFARNIVYKVCQGQKKCGKILAGEKEAYVLEIVKRMMKETEWRQKMVFFVKGETVNKEVLDEEELDKFAKMMAQFINRAQQKYLGGEMTVGEVAKNYLDNKDISEREKVFIELGVECFRRYHWYLLSAKDGLAGFQEYGTDFNLIVSWASKLIASGRPEVIGLLGNKKYVLIDEYQDFSQLFLAAVEAIRSVAVEAKLFVVGDDWQAINRFAGSDVEYFKEFEKFFPDRSKRLGISTNYRCDYTVVDTARKFMRRSMKEKGHFKPFSKDAGVVFVVNPKKTSLNYAYVDYDNRVSFEDKVYKEAAWRLKHTVPNKKVTRYLKTVVEVIKECHRCKEIMILHRNNEINISSTSLERLSDTLRWCLDRLGVMTEAEFESKVRIMTMHKSKGLEAEAVIILEADEGVIPKTHPDTLLYGIFGETEEIALSDQKRLFYVAMTRAKRRLFILSEGGGFVKYLGRGVEKWGE